MKTGEYQGFIEKFKMNGWDEEKIDDTLSFMTKSGTSYFIVMNNVENYLVMIIGYDYSEYALRDNYQGAAEEESDGGNAQTSDAYDGKWPAGAPEEIIIAEFADGQIVGVYVTYGVSITFSGMTRDEVMDYINLYINDSEWHQYSSSVDDTWITYSGQKNNVMLTLEYDVDVFDVIWEILK